MAPNHKSKRSTKLLKPKSNYDPAFFTLPHPALGGLTLSLLLYLAVTTLCPDILPDFLWPFAQLSKYMGNQQFNLCIAICVFTLIAHSMEAAYAGKVCHDRRYRVSATVKWTLSTFLFGFPSMIRLLPHKPRSKLK